MTPLEYFYLIYSLLLVIAGGASLESNIGRSLVLACSGGLVALALLSGAFLQFAQFLMNNMPNGPVELQFVTTVVVLCLTLAVGIGVLTGIGMLLEMAFSKFKKTDLVDNQ